MTALVTRVNGEIVAETRNGVRHFHAHDAQGNTIALYEDSGTKTDTYTYWPYGAVRTRTGTTVNPYQYSGAWGCYKDSTGRTYMQVRTLRHDLTRWVSVDPLWASEQSYGYCRANPISENDPSGLLSCNSMRDSSCYPVTFLPDACCIERIICIPELSSVVIRVLSVTDVIIDCARKLK
jgi:RHS repeat-associated protein